MRILILFDLPVNSTENRRAYSKFHKFLLKAGFMMLQYSVYSKLVLNATVAQSVIANLEKNKPDKGLVQMLIITEKQYSKMVLLLGEAHSETLDTDERLVIF